MTARLQREAFDAVIDEAMPLLRRHWQEIAAYDDIPLSIDREQYTRIDQAGLLRIFTARDGATGALIGYAAFIVGPNAHYSGSRQAKQDVIYVDPERRHSLVGIRLIDFADRELWLDGVQVVYQHQKLAHPALGAVLKHRGYEAVETIWAKRLDLAFGAAKKEEAA